MIGNHPHIPEINANSIMASMNAEAQTEAAHAMVASAAAAGESLELEDAATHVAQLVDASRRPSMEFSRNDDDELGYFRRTVTALQEGLRYGNPALRIGAAIVAGEVHDVLLYAHDAPMRILGLPVDQQMGDRLDTLHTALRVGSPADGTVQEQLVRTYVLPDGDPQAQRRAAEAIVRLTGTAG